LAAARVGYGFAHESLIAMLLKIKLPFEPGGPASAAALGALEDYEFVAASVANNAVGLHFLTAALRELEIEVVPSAGNFLMLVFPTADQAQQIFQGLLERGVIIRPLASTGLPNCLRVSVGTPDENRIFIDTLQGVMSELEVDKYATTC
jgi:histidinol-phosphate aminotransferase